MIAKKTQGYGIFELVSLMIIYLLSSFAFNIFFNWAEKEYAISILGIGRRADLGSILAMCCGAFITYTIARILGIKSV